jgi:hypothetical protein
MVLVKPATVVQWHRKGFRLSWRWRSRRLGRPRMSTEIRDLIRRMSLANPLWGAPGIHRELLKLGIEVSQATVGRYLPWRPKVPSPTWRSFLHNQLTNRHCGDRHVRCGNREFSSSFRSAGSNLLCSMLVKFQQRYVKSHRNVVNCLWAKAFGQFCSSHGDHLVSRSVLGA